MPNRIIREEILTSERVNSLDHAAEVFFFRLMLKADDFGRYTAHPSLLKAGLYPLRLDAVREADITRWIATCEKAGLIALYEEQGKRFLVIPNFRQRTRAKHAKYPAPPDSEPDGGHVTDTRQSHAHGDGGVVGDGGERRADALAPEVPNMAEFCSQFMADAIPPEYLEAKWAWFEGNNAWLGRDGQLKKYQILVRQWWAKDRPTWRKDGANKRNTNQSVDRNAGTANASNTNTYAGIGKV